MVRKYVWRSNYQPDTEKLRELLSKDTDEQKLNILQQTKGVWDMTALHVAAYRDDAEMITTILSSLKPSDRLKLLMMRDNVKCTPLHEAAWRGNSKSVRIILDCLAADHQIQIMSVQDYVGETAIQYAERRRHTDTVRVLKEYQQRANNLSREEYSKFTTLHTKSIHQH